MADKSNAALSILAMGMAASAGGGSGATTWGNITGNIESQDDLQHALGNKVDKGTLSTVAESGDYDDLINTPTIPEVPAYPIEDGNYVLNITNGEISWVAYSPQEQ